METKNINKLPYLSKVSQERLYFGICMLCIFLFLFSAYGKITEHQTFVHGLSPVKFIGDYAKIIGWSVPIIEISISILLMIPKTQKAGLYGFTAAMTVFTLYILSMLFLAEKRPCQCNLIVSSLSWGQHLWFNLTFIGLPLIALLLKKHH